MVVLTVFTFVLLAGAGCSDEFTPAATGEAAAGGSGGEAGGEAGGAGGAGASGQGGGGGQAGGGGVLGANPHPLYPPLDLDTLPGDGGAESGPYRPPALPDTSRTVTVSTTGSAARAELVAACDTPGTAVDVPSAAGNIGVVNIGNVDDCDITLGADVVLEYLVIGSLAGPTHAPSHRVRIRGGQIANIFIAYGTTDIVLDGVVINNGVVPSAQRAATAVNMTAGDGADDVVDRVAIVNSFIRTVELPAGGGEINGAAFLLVRARNLLFANNNIATSGNHNSWGFRLSGGDNVLIVDNTVRVSFHKLVRMNDNPVDYAYISGGVWMREATLTSGGMLVNDSFAQLSGSSTHNVYVHDPTVYLLPDARTSFGATPDAIQAGRSWEARRITWHVLNEDVVSTENLQQREDNCINVGGDCDYGIGTHTYVYDAALTLPENPWRDLPDFENDDPDSLPAEL